MPVVSFCSGIFCRGEEAAQAVAAALRVKVYTDEDLISKASAISGLEPEKIRRALFSKPPLRIGSKRLRPSAVPYLRSAMAALLQEGGSSTGGWAPISSPRA